jgi:hypothetical protein
MLTGIVIYEYENCDGDPAELLDLENLTTKYMQGQDNGQYFIFSDCDEGIEAIKKAFPNEPLVSVKANQYPFDYDYRRDT